MGKETNFIWKASRPARWWTHVLKNPLNLALISRLFYFRERGNMKTLRAGGNDWPQTSGWQQGSEDGWEISFPWLTWLFCQHRSGQWSSNKSLTIQSPSVRASLSLRGRQVTRVVVSILSHKQNYFLIINKPTCRAENKLFDPKSKSAKETDNNIKAGIPSIFTVTVLL